MKFTALPIEGAFTIKPRKIEDKRGAFARVNCTQTFAEQGLNTQWVQMNVSINKQKGQVRGLHFQRPPRAEIKLVLCVVGVVYDVIVDLREGSPTFGEACGVTLSGDALDVIYIPAGCAHGFQTQTDFAILHYGHSEIYSPEHEDGVSVLDPDLGLGWPLSIKNLSERDRGFPRLAELTPIKL